MRVLLLLIHQALEKTATLVFISSSLLFKNLLPLPPSNSWMNMATKPLHPV
jgi:hypothetical protein